MNNQEFAKTNDKFQNACVEANIPATRCQAGKWQRQVGIAYLVSKGKRQPLDQPPGDPFPKNTKLKRRR